MHLTLHLTTSCNMKCSYCYSPPRPCDGMSREVAFETLELGARLNSGSCGIVFFGGEPLLHKDLIAATVGRAREMEAQKRGSFHFKLTTNGVLLDEEFLDFSIRNDILVAMSFDGVREAQRIQGIRTGTPFEVTLLTSSDSPGSQQSARIVKAHLADCGIRVNLETIPAWEFFADGPEGPFFGRQFDMAETAWWFDVDPPCGHYLSLEIPDEGRWYGGNVTGYTSPDYDAVCQAALLALPGSPEYEEYHRQAQIIFSNELPAIPLFTWLRVAAARPGVLNFTLDSTAPSELWNLEMLDVE